MGWTFPALVTVSLPVLLDIAHGSSTSLMGTARSSSSVQQATAVALKHGRETSKEVERNSPEAPSVARDAGDKKAGGQKSATAKHSFNSGPAKESMEEDRRKYGSRGFAAPSNIYVPKVDKVVHSFVNTPLRAKRTTSRGWKSGPGISTVPESVLDGITDVECLERKRRDPMYLCNGRDAGGRRFSGESDFFDPSQPLSVGNYPALHEEACRSGTIGSGGEFFCDPDGLLDEPQRNVLFEKLRLFRQHVAVPCPKKAGVVRPFRLGIALASEFPRTQADPETLEEFGAVLLQRFKMLTEAELNSCPAAALLLVVAENPISIISAPSCEFICTSRGGDGVISVLQARLMEAEDPSHSPSDLVEALFQSIDEVVRTLQKTAPVPDTTALTLVPGLLPTPTKPPEGRLSPGTQAEQLGNRDELWASAQQLFFLGLLATALIGIVACIMRLGGKPDFQGKMDMSVGSTLRL